MPSEVRACDWYQVAPMAVATFPLSAPYPVTSSGTKLAVLEFTPNWPLLFQPQEKTCPSLLKASECCIPTATSVMVLPASTPVWGTAVGIWALALSPLPSWP